MASLNLKGFNGMSPHDKLGLSVTCTHFALLMQLRILDFLPAGWETQEASLTCLSLNFFIY
jgi:hypothetical protein